MLERSAGLSAKIYFCAGSSRKFLVSGNKIGVQVSFKNMAYGEPVFFRSFQSRWGSTTTASLCDPSM
jgi:hypothetical protein